MVGCGPARVTERLLACCTPVPVLLPVLTAAPAATGAAGGAVGGFAAAADGPIAGRHLLNECLAAGCRTPEWVCRAKGSNVSSTQGW